MLVLAGLLVVMTLTMLALPRFIQSESRLRSARMLLAMGTMVGFSLYLNVLVHEPPEEKTVRWVPLNDALEAAVPSLQEAPDPGWRDNAE